MRKYILLAALFCSSISVFAQKHNLKISGGFSYALTQGFVGDVYDVRFANGQDNYKSGERKNHSLPGLNLSTSYGISDCFSLKFDVSGYRGSKTATIFPGTIFVKGSVDQPTFVLVIPGLNTYFKSSSYYNFLIGAEYRNSKSKRKLVPFGHLLAGIGIERAKYESDDAEFDRIRKGKNTVTNTGLEMNLGGGLDLSINRLLDLRILQIDYTPFFPMKKDILSIGDIIDPLNEEETYYSFQTISTSKSVQNNFRLSIGVVYHLCTKK